MFFYGAHRKKFFKKHGIYPVQKDSCFLHWGRGQLLSQWPRSLEEKNINSYLLHFCRSWGVYPKPLIFLATLLAWLTRVNSQIESAAGSTYPGLTPQFTAHHQETLRVVPKSQTKSVANLLCCSPGQTIQFFKQHYGLTIRLQYINCCIYESTT